MTFKSSLKGHGAAPHVALIAVQLMFGSWPIIGKAVLRVITTTELVAIRIAGASVAFLLIQRKWSQLRRMPKRDIAWLAICCLLGVVLNQLLYVKGLSLTTVINATLLTTTIPVFTLVVSIALGYDRLSLRRCSGVLLAAGGVVYLVDPFRADLSAHSTLGNLVLVANCLFYGAYIALSKDLIARYGALNVITWIFVLGSIVTLPLGARSLSGARLEALGPLIWFALLYIVIVPTVGAYYLNAWALSKVTPSTVAAYVYLQPLIAFGLAPLFLGEHLRPRTLLASILIFTGVGVVISRGRSRAVREVAEHPDALAH